MLFCERSAWLMYVLWESVRFLVAPYKFMSALHRKKLERPASVRAAQILHRTEKTAHQRARLMYGAFALREMTSLVCALRWRLWQASLF